MATVTFSPAELQALAKQVAPLLTPVTPPVVPPVVTPPPVAGTFWLYHNGVSASGGADYDFGSGSVSYNVPDPVVVPGKCILVAGDEGFQPRMPNDDFNTAGFNFLTVSICPTQPGNTWITGIEMAGDATIPGSNGAFSIMQYGPSPAVPNQWNTYKVPLSAYSIPPAGLHILKAMWLEQSSTNKSGNKVYFKDIGFVP